MKLYIKLPEGMMLAQKTAEHRGKEVLKDFLIDPKEQKEDIPLQDCVKEFLRTYRKHTPNKEVDGLMIYSKPGFNEKHDSAQFLEYFPQKNGAAPSKSKKIIKGEDIKSNSPFFSSGSGLKWHQYVPLNKKRKEEVLEKEDETRQNRRHTGDSPKAT